ncbi:TolC family outer membrane protein [Sphingorhabdus soli]|uniref:TolC family outer membrane protein n=1 Tax=Flavisphingopyxis soli TaxID=2601267 RepID=A0A5C6U710_9SPHN|nr:TolC family outer membrane protein [Sphingorhabdus soli]TXC68652.1 TolC family outer membrane protein [Sphingorhabdus soli]
MRFPLLVGTALVALALPAAASADTLRDALAKAYENNPTLTGARASQRVTDETVPLARANGLPNVGVQGSYTEYVLQSSNNFTSPDRAFSIGPQISIPIYQGGAVKNAVNAAEKRVEAGQANLRATESSIFSQAVAAYMDVIRDQALVALNRSNVDVLGVNRQATGDRFEIGDLTRTDVAQSESRLATARSQLQTAESRLISSRERYIQIIGDAPTDLQPPPPLPNLPASPQEAVTVALADNPDIEAAQITVDATRYDIRTAKASRLPQVSLTGQTGYVNYLGTIGSNTPGVSFAQSSTTGSAGITATIPIFQGGRPAAQVRQAQARSSQSMERLVETERSVVAQVRSAFASWQASLQVIQSAQVASDAAQLSLEGVRAENSVGNRTILDILNAEQEYLNAQVTLVSSRRDAYVAAFTLLAAMGKAEAQDLGLDGGALYDPQLNYDRVRNRVWDWDQDPAPAPQATTTVNTPAQNAQVTDDAASPMRTTPAPQ